MKEVYLDYAATAPVLPEAAEAARAALADFGNPDSLHAYGRRAAEHVTRARDEVADLLGVKPSEVYFTSGGTEADNWAILGMGGGSAVLSPIEHAALLTASARRGGGARLCRVGADGIVTPAMLAEAMEEGTGLAAVMAVNNETGVIQPVEALAALAHARGAYFFSDCVQAACSLDLGAICRAADGISLSAHKIGGFKGTGALVVKKGVPLRPLVTGGEQERGLRGGTLNVAGIAAFATALGCVRRERAAFCERVAALRDRFEGQILAALPGVVRDGEDRVPNISHLTFPAADGALLSLLDLKGVACSGGAACSAHSALPSHVLLAMGRTEERARQGIRFSFGQETTEEEVDFAAAAVISCFCGG